MHLLNVLSLSITIIHSWNRKQACLCLQWFQNEADHSITFLSCYLNVHVCIFYIFAGWSTVWWRKIENSVREKNLISFFHFTCHNIPRITTVSCWVLTLWKLLFCTCNILCFRCTNWVCFWIVSLQCYPPCLRLWLTRGLLHIYGHSTFPRGSGRSLWTCDT